MIRLYTSPTPNGRKISIALEELELPYVAISVDLDRREQHDPAFVHISPNAKIPAIVDGDVTMSQSGAILMYLADKRGQLSPAKGTEDYWQMVEWLMWQMGDFGPMLGQAHHFLKFNRGRSEYAENRYHNEANRLYGVLDRHLEQRDYIVRELSIADIATWPWVSRFEYQDVALNAFPNVLRWYRSLAERPSFQRGYVQPIDVGPVPVP